MTLIDITRTLTSTLATWPGDSPFEKTTIMSLADGASVNLTTLRLSAHTGSHMDAPYHFVTGGQTVEQLDLGIYWGQAQVVTVIKDDGPLLPEDFAGYDLGRAPRLLVHSPASAVDPTVFPDCYVYPSPALADHLGALGIILFGSDAPSMDPVDSKRLDGHHALRRNGVAILEGLQLSDVADGVYELVALPLKIGGGDGSPVRAALRSLG